LKLPAAKLGSARPQVIFCVKSLILSKFAREPRGKTTGNALAMHVNINKK